MNRNIFQMVVLLALVVGGVQKLPCIQMGFVHDCCAVENSAAVSNPSKECCGAETDKGLPALGVSDVLQISYQPVLAVADIFHQTESFSVAPFVNAHWGGTPHLPSYLEHATLLL